MVARWPGALSSHSMSHLAGLRLAKLIVKSYHLPASLLSTKMVALFPLALAYFPCQTRISQHSMLTTSALNVCRPAKVDSFN